ncbi:uncharacterized protein EDB91DRAFT_1087218 [Suillus paluster]|uniref:uncharacterized protein n=1 Tax=Suillus paluster TaxID=48578 RepID=UPI001B865BF5|nr:uncharacterized protein EDB91DRAFT_1087218 [Suillus paluster]KAG1725157.1 hypothetical protein EDB91DRAFT_1087218 [Suillus paluster]
MTCPKKICPNLPLNPVPLLYLQPLWHVGGIPQVHQNHQAHPQVNQSTLDPLASILLSRRNHIHQSRMMRNENKKESKSDLHEEYLAAARCITRCVDMFCKIDKVIDIGTLLKQCKLADSGDISEDEDEAAHQEKQLSKLSQKTRDRYQQNYKCLLELAPGLKPLIAGSKDPKKASELRRIIRKMESAILGTHSDDSTHLKMPICDYVAPNPADKAVVPPLHDGSGQCTHLGVNHPVLARFLCPIGEIENFNEDPTITIEWLQSGKIRMEADTLPAFLWNGDLPGGNYDPDNMMDGFLDGFVLERTMRHIFTGPSTAYGAQSRGTRPSNAALHAMTTVEPPHIAYGCVQVQFGISSRNTWTEEDSDFNYHDFYRYIIELINDLPDNDKEQLLKDWNLKLFKNEAECDVAKDGADEFGPLGACKGGSDLACLRAQMAACNAAAKTCAMDSEHPAAPLHHPSPTQENLPPPSRTPPPSSPTRRSPHCPTQPKLTPLSKDTSTFFTGSQHPTITPYCMFNQASCVKSIGYSGELTSTPSTTITSSSFSSTLSIASKDFIASQLQHTWQ